MLDFWIDEADILPRHSCGIYLLSMQLPCGNYAVKIGRSSNPQTRLASFQTVLPFEFSMAWTKIGILNWAAKIEKHLHQAFDENHTRGEWFMFDPDELDEISAKVSSEISKQTQRKVSWTKVLPDATHRPPPNDYPKRFERC